MHPISEKLIAWYKKNKRDLPWRNTNDPYKIWLSEIMLQQTQVAQGLSYYLKFTETFPTVKDLANAPEDQVMRLWQGLGYYSRARNLHAASKHVVTFHKGNFPKTYLEIKELKGVGDYTAAAISSFAYNLPHAVVDGNVYRVLSRLFDVHTPINSSQGKKEFQLLANELLDNNKPGQHNNAIMEFGAMQCKPQNPNCETCILQNNCSAYANNTVSLLPVKIKTSSIKHRYFNYVVINYKNSVYISKRSEKDIWQNLYEFLLIENDSPVSEKEVLTQLNNLGLKDTYSLKNITEVKKHILSHQHLHSFFYEVELSKPTKLKGFIKVKKDELNNFGFPQLINRYLKMRDGKKPH